MDLFYRQKSWRTPHPVKKLNYELTRRFLAIIAGLRQEHFHSDQVMFGIDIPEFDDRYQWIYPADPEEKIWVFNSFIADVFGKFDIWAVGGHGVQASVSHLPTFRNRQRVQAVAA